MLRGIAVLLVVLYHAKLKTFSAGYLGVDVFFVISGYLITSLIRDALDKGQFSLREFYYRRAKRLLPAAYATFLATSLLAPILLTRSEIASYFEQLIGALTFTANMVLYGQEGYFSVASELKPLLHTWSLSVEEQFYFVFPLFLIATPRRHWSLAVGLALVASVSAYCYLTLSGQPSAAFYLLPSRAWQIMIGALGALVATRPLLSRVSSVLFWPSLLAILVLSTRHLQWHGIDLSAFLVTVSTLFILLRRHRILEQGPVVAVLRKIGDMSYSLYLVHWPIFAFVNNAWIHGSRRERIAIQGAALLLSGLATLLLHYAIEKRFHHGRPRHVPALIVTSSLTLVGVAFLVRHVGGARDQQGGARTANVGLSALCDASETFAPRTECASQPAPKLLVWGDSFAMHLIPGLVTDDSDGLGLLQATKSGCSPVFGVAAHQLHESAQRCIHFNDSVMRYLENSETIDTVLLSSPFSMFVSNPTALARTQNGGLARREWSPEQAVDEMTATVSTLRSLGKKVILVAPPPSQGFDVARCIERRETGLLSFDRTSGCRISRSAAQRYRAAVLAFLEETSRRAEVEVISLDPWMCEGDICETRAGEVVLYRDHAHLSIEGSKLLAEENDLFGLVLGRAK